MKIAIMQPYLFPYIGYFSLIKNTDYFVFFDTPQYIRKGWINRNRIIGVTGGATFFTIPVQKAKRETPINEIIISQHENWKMKILGQLNVYKKAPYFNDVMELVNDTLSLQTQSMSDIAIASVVKTCEYLGIHIKYDVFSTMNLQIPNVNEPDEWALYITKELGYDTYVNPPGGKAFFNVNKYKNQNIELQFLEQEIIPYEQNRKEFIPSLSIIDVMMFCDKESILKMCEKYILEE